MTSYRPEIDGLRAVAVVPVILFHAGAGFFSGGYAGVDVFFVISGYLITDTILRDTAAGSFSFVAFYERRARRILPALFVVMAACVPFAWLWLLPGDLRDFLESLAAVVVFLSNHLFFSETGYFEAQAELKPLLHTWSLSIEEQYYLLFPLFVVGAMRRRRRTVVATLSVLAIASLLFAQWSAHHKPAAGYLLLPSRAWELAMGALVALCRRQALPLVTRGAVGGLLAALGLALIAVAVIAFDERTPYPSLFTLFPTVGAALVILFAAPATWTGRMLSGRPLVAVGLVSYSAYLWHQPLLSFARHRSLDEPSPWLMGALVGLTFVLALASHRFVERPFRRVGTVDRRAFWAAAAGASASFLALGLVRHFSDGFVSRHAAFEQAVAVGTVERVHCHNAGRRTADQVLAGQVCTGGDGPRTFAVIGDSHAGAVFDALSAMSRRDSFDAISGDFCPPLPGYRLSFHQRPECPALMHATFRHLAASPQIVDVVLIAEWAVYTEGFRDSGNGKAPKIGLASDARGSATTPDGNAAVFARALAAAVRSLQEMGKTVYIVHPVPEFDAKVTPIQVRAQLLGIDPRPHAVVTKANYLRRNADVLREFGALRGVRFIELERDFCSHELCHGIDEDGRALFSDTNHVNAHGAQRIAAGILATIAR